MSNSNMRDMQHQYTRCRCDVCRAPQQRRKDPLLEEFQKEYGRKPMYDEALEMTRTGKVPAKPHPEGWDL